MRHKTTETVFNYFNSLRAGRSAPLRKEIEPAALKSVLPDLFIMEKGRDGTVRFRLAGTRICNILGREMRDSSFADLWEPTARHRMRLAADAVIANRNALEVAVSGTSDDSNILSLEMLMLPLMSDRDHCDRIFGSLVVVDEPPPLEPVLGELWPADMVFAPSPLPRLRQADDHGLPVIGGFATRFGRLRVLEGGKRS